MDWWRGLGQNHGVMVMNPMVAGYELNLCEEVYWLPSLDVEHQMQALRLRPTAKGVERFSSHNLDIPQLIQCS